MSSEKDEAADLTLAAEQEAEFVRAHLKEELGRPPTREEIDEWLREHTESY